MAVEREELEFPPPPLLAYRPALPPGPWWLEDAAWLDML